MKYIDVSTWQGKIDWEKVKGNIAGAILRAGYGKGKPDERFARNAAECNRLGIPCGAYWLSYAKSAEEARAEARYLLAAVKPYRMELPLCYDFEYASVDNAKAQGVEITKELASSFVTAFCEEIERGGYWALNYANPDYLNRLYDEKLTERFGLWLAAWKLSGGADLSDPPRRCDIWQWGLSTVPGIAGSVDTNESYRDFPKVIRQAGLNHLNGYAEDDGSMTWEFAQQPQKPTDPAQDALKWAQDLGIVTGSTETDKAIALALWRYHSVTTPEDNKTTSGPLEGLLE